MTGNKLPKVGPRFSVHQCFSQDGKPLHKDTNVGITICGSWYIARQQKNNPHLWEYLHRDGVIRYSMRNFDTSEFSGWFQKREDARDVLRMYNKERNEQ